jgi:hypothetical protein
VKSSWTSWAWRQKTNAALGPRPPFKITSEEPKVAVQVAGGPQSPTRLLG